VAKMRSGERASARKQLDKRLNPLRDSHAFSRPARGWVKAVREALGMSAEQLAKRIGVTKPRIYELEKAETTGSISLESLERAAHALDCQLVYALVPKNPLQTLVEERAYISAKRRIKNAAHSMALEDQSVDKDDQLAQLEVLARELINKSPSEIWEDE
jgi:predicted DNA-binding mobile mystery protein A